MHRTRRRMLAAIAGVPTYLGPLRREAPNDDPGAGSTEGGAGGTGSTGTGSSGNTGAAGGQGDPANNLPKIDGDLDKDRAARALQSARDSETKAKQRAQAAEERVTAILKAAGLTPDGKTDPAEQLKAAAAERDQALSAAKQTAIELAIYKHAGKAGGDAEALLDSRNFLDAVKDLDPTASDFGDKVADAIKAAIKANPKLAATATQGGQGPARQGADHSGGTNNRQRPTSLGAAISARMIGQ